MVGRRPTLQDNGFKMVEQEGRLALYFASIILTMLWSNIQLKIDFTKKTWQLPKLKLGYFYCTQSTLDTYCTQSTIGSIALWLKRGCKDYEIR